LLVAIVRETQKVKRETFESAIERRFTRHGLWRWRRISRQFGYGDIVEMSVNRQDNHRRMCRPVLRNMPVSIFNSSGFKDMDMSMAFERLMTQILGQKAYQSAGQFANPTTRDDWFRKTFKLMLKEVDKIDITSRQKQMLMRDLQAAIDGLSGLRDPSWEVMFSLVSACARFLGHDYSGARVNTPCYWQSPDQRFTKNRI
jgi:hypothetical protein